MLEREQKKFLGEAMCSGSMNYETILDRGWDNDRDFILEAVRQDGDALGFASEELQNDREIALEAVKQCGEALVWASEELQNDPEFMLETVAQNSDVLKEEDLFAKHFRDEDFVGKVNVSIKRYLKSLIPEDISDDNYEWVKAKVQNTIKDIEESKARIQLRIKEEDEENSMQEQRKAELNDMIDFYVSKETKRDGK